MGTQEVLLAGSDTSALSWPLSPGRSASCRYWLHMVAHGRALSSPSPVPVSIGYHLIPAPVKVLTSGHRWVRLELARNSVHGQGPGVGGGVILGEVALCIPGFMNHPVGSWDNFSNTFTVRALRGFSKVYQVEENW